MALDNVMATGAVHRGWRPAPMAEALPPAVARSSDQLLVEAVRRAARHPERRLVLVLHLSRLAPPAPRPHHRRIARAILEDTARRHEGQVFALGNGDLVLLCRDAGDEAAGHAADRGDRHGAARQGRPGGGLALPDPAALPGTLARLLRSDAQDPACLTTLWRLTSEAEAVAAYAAARAAEAAASPPPAPADAAETEGGDTLTALSRRLDAAALPDLLCRQTGVAVIAAEARQPGAGAGPALRPVYRAVAARSGPAGADPYQHRHLARRLDARLLAGLRAAIGGGGPLDPAGRVPALHVPLTPAGILADGLAAVAKLCREAGAALGVEVALADACEDAATFRRAREKLAALGITLVLGGVSHLALLLARPWTLQPDLLKLDWSPLLAGLAAEEREMLAATLDEIGPHRLVLAGADTEAALHWGLGQGIRRFQGRHVEAMLAAGRSAACAAGHGCSLRQCIERAAATGPAGRAGCREPARLDTATPPGDRP